MRSAIRTAGGIDDYANYPIHQHLSAVLTNTTELSEKIARFSYSSLECSCSTSAPHESSCFGSKRAVARHLWAEDDAVAACNKQKVYQRKEEDSY